MSEWKIGVSSWIIQDGNYEDFRHDEEVTFALEFFPLNHTPSLSSVKQAKWLQASKYKVNAQLIFVDKHCCVIDFGVLAYQRVEPPKTLQHGMWLEAEINLGIDPFFYFESLTRIKGMPPLIYTWHVHKIEVETAPFIESVDAMGHRLLMRDETKSAFREVQQTNAWSDDNGRGEYVLSCTLLDVPPKRDRG